MDYWTNTIFGKVGMIAYEEVTRKVIKSKFVPILLYGQECSSLPKADVKVSRLRSYKITNET